MARRQRRSVAQWLDDAERAERQVDYSLPWWAVLALVAVAVTGLALGSVL